MEYIETDFPVTSMELVQKVENKKLLLRKTPLGIDACLNLYYCYSPNVDLYELPSLEEELINAKVQIIGRIFQNMLHKVDNIKDSNLTIISHDFDYFSIKVAKKILKLYPCKSFREYVRGLPDPFLFFLTALNEKIKIINKKIQPLCVNPVDIDFYVDISEVPTKAANYSVHYVFKFKHKDKRLLFLNKCFFIYVDNLNLDPETYSKIPVFKINWEVDIYGNKVFTREFSI